MESRKRCDLRTDSIAATVAAYNEFNTSLCQASVKSGSKTDVQLQPFINLARYVHAFGVIPVSAEHGTLDLSDAYIAASAMNCRHPEMRGLPKFCISVVENDAYL